jgi:hypothetical protein
VKPKLISVFFIIFAHSLVASFWYLEDEVRFEKIPSALEIIDGYKNSQNLRDNDAAILDKIAYFLKISDRKEHLRILDKKLNDIDEETIKKRYPNISQNNFFSFLIEEPSPMPPTTAPGSGASGFRHAWHWPVQSSCSPACATSPRRWGCPTCLAPSSR